MNGCCDTQLIYWPIANRRPPQDLIDLAEAWAADHPDALGVASVEGIMVGIRPEHNRTSRQGWNDAIAADAALRDRVTCPSLTMANLLPTDHVAREQARAEAVAQDARKIRKTTLAEKIGTFLSAVTGPTVSDEEAARRLTICRTNECGHLVTKNANEYCGACGCPKWRLAELKTKLRFANLQCPCDPPLW
jgi:hypothetical protein